jgi:hypothetical protein
VETRAIDLGTALLVALAALCCSVVVGCAFVLLVAVADGKALPGSDDRAAWCAAAGVACASVAALIALTHPAGGLRPAALAAAWVLAFAWPLSGFPLLAAAIATPVTGLAVTWGASGRAGTRAAVVLAVAALELLTVAFATAPDGTGYQPQAAARAAAARDDTPPPGADGRASRDAAEPLTAAAGDSAVRAAPRRPSPARVVRAYYAALDRRDFERSWRTLSPAVRTAFGGLDRWRAGIGATLASVPSALRVTVVADDAAVDHILTARDRAACGTLIQRFDVHWRLRRTPRGWLAVALSATQRAGARCLTS